MRRLCEINSFPIPSTGLAFFGLRGCLPIDSDNHGFAAEHEVDLAAIDYLHPRCTIGQWRPEEATVALFPASTVPHLKYIRSARERSGLGANQLMTGYYKDYRRGMHKAGNSTGHPAFRQIEGRPIRRTSDDFNYDNDDRVEFSNPYDNLHAAWSMGINHDDYSSAGCQVVVGYPRCAQRGDLSDTGPWDTFKKNAYQSDQDSFPYMLLEARDAYRIYMLGRNIASVRLRFGSRGPLVKTVQEALKKQDFYEGNSDEEFGERTIRSVLRFQESKFGPHADDGIVGLMTASALGIQWPEV